MTLPLTLPLSPPPPNIPYYISAFLWYLYPANFRPEGQSFTLKESVVANPIILFETTLGNFKLELDAEKAPISTANFVDYVTAGFYTGTIFHRVIAGFMAQGGGFDVAKRQKPTKAPIQNEAANGLKNLRGTVAMARTSDLHSATAQFFINLVDNDFLDHQDTSQQGYGYAVFGKVIEGMEVIDKMATIPTIQNRFSEAFPQQTIAVRKATVVS